MVKRLTKKDQTAVAAAIKKAEHHLSAKIEFVAVDASDGYRDFVILYSFIIGALAAITFWAIRPNTMYLWLLAIQLGVMIVLDLVSPLRRLLLLLVPRSLCHRRALEAARNHYHILHERVPRDVPFVLLFVSLLERYVHVLTNPVVHQQIPQGWESVTDRFTASITKMGMRQASLTAIGQMTDRLATHFQRR